MKKRLFRALALLVVALIGAGAMYVRAAEDTGTDPEVSGSVVFDTSAGNPYNLGFRIGGYLPAGSIMKDGPISIVFNNDRFDLGVIYGPSSSAEGASLTVIPDAGYKVTQVTFINRVNGKDFTSNFEEVDNTFTKTTSGSLQANIVVDYEADPEMNVADDAVANAFTAAISESARYAYSCLSNIGFIGDEAKNIVYTTLPDALRNFKTESANFKSVDEVNAYFANEKATFQGLVQADIDAAVVDPEIMFTLSVQAMADAKKSNTYFSNSLYAIDCADNSYVTTSNFSFDCYFDAVAAGEEGKVFNLQSPGTGLNMATATGGSLVGPKSEDMPNELALKMVLNGSHVQLLLADNADKAVGVDTETGRMCVMDATEEATMLNPGKRTVKNFMESASNSINNWGTNMPDFSKDEITDFRNQMTASENFEEAREVIKAAQQAMIEKFTRGEVNISIKGFSNKFINSVDGVLKTDAAAADAQRWSLTFDPTETAYNKVVLFNATTGEYLGADCTMVKDAEKAASFALVFECGSSASLVIPGKSSDNCLTSNSTDYELFLGNYGNRFETSSSLNLNTFKFVYNPLPLAEVVTVLTEGLEKAEQLGKLYLKSIPFAGKTATDIVEKTIGGALDNIDPVASPLRSVEEAEAYVATQMENLENALMSDLNATIGKNELVLWQPGQKGYLSALTRDPGNKGYVVFDYQAKINENAAWSLVADGEEGQFFMKSSKGQYISTPNQNYCHVADEQPTSPDGAFTFGLKDGYVVFKSMNHEGCGLGFDCQNDPVEIMSLNDGSKGYRWQLALMDNYRHNYVTLRSDRWTVKAGHDVYLQDANEPVVYGNSSSTLSSTDVLSANTIWEVSAGTAEGSYHIRNFATGRYLVKLDTPSQTVDNPVNIWLAPNGNGVSISTGTNPNNYYTCLDADNNGVNCGKWHTDGGNGTIWYQDAVSEEDVRAKYGNVYVTFEANRQDAGSSHWGVYLQDSFYPKAGTTATLCGVDSICQNAIWQITPGTVEGAYHVQNFATKRYLVELNANGSKTVSEPVDIWMPDFTLGEKAGVQISTAETPDKTDCLATNETDNLAGCGANNEATLWFKSQLDEYTDEQISNAYPAADRAIALAIEAQATKLKADCENYLESVPCGEDIVNGAIEKLDGILANCDEVAKDFKRVAFVAPYFKELKASYEIPLLKKLNETVAEGDAYTFQINSRADGLCYYSSSLYAVETAEAGLLPTKEISAGNLFRFVENGSDFTIYSVNTNSALYGSNAAANTIGTLGGFTNTEISFRLTLENGFVRLNVVKADKTLAPAGLNSSRGTLGTNSVDAATFDLKLKAYTLTEVAEMANTQLGLWGALMPKGDKIASEAASLVNTAASAEAIGKIMTDSKKSMIEALVNCDTDVYFKSIGTDLFIGYDAAWYSNFALAEASAWKFTAPADYELTGTYGNIFLMKDEPTGEYLTYRCGNSKEPNIDPNVATPDYYAIVFDNPGVITITIPRNSNWNALMASGEGINCNNAFGDRFKAESLAPYCFAFVMKEVSGVENVTIDYTNDAIYDLNGNRVANPGKGIFIVNGKKVVIR